MTEMQLVSVSAGLVAVMFGLLATVIGWIGGRAINSIDAMRDKLSEVAGELHSRINGIDNRVVAVETRFEAHCATHPGFNIKNAE